MTSIRGISQLVSEAEKVLGPNTVFVITPDNGGSVWSEIVNSHPRKSSHFSGTLP